LSKGKGGGDSIIDFSLDVLQKYLLEKKVITNKNWLNEIIYP